MAETAFVHIQFELAHSLRTEDWSIIPTETAAAGLWLLPEEPGFVSAASKPGGALLKK